MAESKTVRAIDLGYGFSKFTRTVNAQGHPVVSVIPSIAVPASNKDMGGQFF